MDIQQVSVIATVGAAVLGLLLAFGRMALGQFERRIGEKFSGLETSMREENRQLGELKREFQEHIKALPMEYVRREDWIRFSSLIDAKLDRLGERLSDLQRAELQRLSGMNRGG